MRKIMCVRIEMAPFVCVIFVILSPTYPFTLMYFYRNFYRKFKLNITKTKIIFSSFFSYLCLFMKIEWAVILDVLTK